MQAGTGSFFPMRNVRLPCIIPLTKVLRTPLRRATTKTADQLKLGLTSASPSILCWTRGPPPLPMLHISILITPVRTPRSSARSMDRPCCLGLSLLSVRCRCPMTEVGRLRRQSVMSILWGPSAVSIVLARTSVIRSPDDPTMRVPPGTLIFMGLPPLCPLIRSTTTGTSTLRTAVLLRVKVQLFVGVRKWPAFLGIVMKRLSLATFEIASSGHPTMLLTGLEEGARQHCVPCLMAALVIESPLPLVKGRLPKRKLRLVAIHILAIPNEVRRSWTSCMTLSIVRASWVATRSVLPSRFVLLTLPRKTQINGRPKTR